MRLWVFSFGSGYYDRQHAVVAAETEEQARGLLLTDIARQTESWPQNPSNTGPDVNFVGERGFLRLYFATDKLGLDPTSPPWSTDQPVVYCYGVDG